MKNIKKLVLLGLALLCVFTVMHPSTVQAQKKWKVALVLPGSTSDKGFNQSAYDGLLKIKAKLGVDTVFSESTPPANFERVVRGFADDGNDIIIGHGFEFTDIMKKVAPDYPKQYFIVSNSLGVNGPNVASFQPDAKDSAFLVGLIAGLTTKTNKIGIVMGFDFPTLVAQTEAFRLGIKTVNPKAESLVSYIGTFDDPAKGKEAALAQISAGADIIYASADSAGLGCIQAADEKGVKAIGWGIDQNALAPKTVIVTQIVDTSEMMYEVVKSILDGKFDGKERSFGLDTPAIGVSDYHGLVDDKTAAVVETWRKAILGGVKIPFLTDKDASLKLDGLKLPDASAAATMSATMAATMAPTAAATAAK